MCHTYLWFNMQILWYTKMPVIVCVLYFVMLQRIKHKQYLSSWHNYAFLFPPSVAYFGCNYLNAFIYQTSLDGCWVYWPSWQYLISHLWRSDFFFHWRGKEEKVHWWREKETIEKISQKLKETPGWQSSLLKSILALKQVQCVLSEQNS